jgi:hypothetical protein
VSEQEAERTAVAWVADLGDRTRFTAHVEYKEPGPFSILSGPHGVDVADAVAWARQHAGRVVVRLGEEFFSAGDVPRADFPEWPHPASKSPPSDIGQDQVAWRVEARTGWFRGDAEPIARRLAEAVRADPATTHTEHDATARGFSVRFTVMNPSEDGAREVASRLLRSAWSAARIEATAHDYDVSSIVVRTAPR